MYLKSHIENKMTRREISSRQAFYAAEGGIEWVKVQIEEDPDFSGGERTIGDATVKVQVFKLTNGYRVISIAQNGLAKRRVEVNLEKKSDQWIITEYQELHS